MKQQKAPLVSHAPVVLRFVTDVQLEELTSVSRLTWRKYRLFNRGPKWYKIGGSVRYNLDEVLRWIENHAGGGEVAAPLTPPATRIR
jgi:predicted DNA-binding transcriptional regulator AlpA